MTHQTFTTVDPRQFDGDPYDVASKGVAQLKGILEVASKLVEPTRLMVRNAEMERRLARGEDAGAAEWDESAESRTWDTVEDTLEQLRARLAILERAAGFNPKAPG